MRRLMTVTGAVLALGIALCTTVRADPVKPGDTLTYEYALKMRMPFTPNPAMSAEQNAAAALAPHIASTTFTFGVAVDRLNADGSAHALISPRYQIRSPFHFVDFEGTVLPDGEIVPTVDLTELKGSGLDVGNSVNPGYRPSTPAQQLAMSGWSFNRWLLLFNDVALGAGKKSAFKDGDVWRIVIPDKDNETITFSYLRSEPYRGHDTVVLGVDTVRTTKDGPAPVKGTVNYDPQRKLIVGLHYEGMDNLSPSQPSMMTTIDVNLQ